MTKESVGYGMYASGPGTRKFGRNFENRICEGEGNSDREIEGERERVREMERERESE